jgi:hypothetical protein
MALRCCRAEPPRKSIPVMKINLPNSANLQNITGFLRDIDAKDKTHFELSMHPKWVAVHPAVLALNACAAESVRASGGSFSGAIPNIGSLPYLIRM